MSIAGAAKVILFRGLQQALLQSIMGSAYEEPDTLVSEPMPSAVAKTAIRNGNSQIVDKLRNLADAMQKEIDSKYNSGVSQQRYTARRAAIAASMAHDGARLERIQAALRWLADQWELGITPRCLLTVRSKKAVEQVLTGYYTDNGKASHGITNAGDFESAKNYLQMGAAGTPKAVDPERQIRGLENELRGRKIDGFFPTPKSVWEWMKASEDSPIRKLYRWINSYNYANPLKVIDPSAGIGSLLDYLKDEYHASATNFNWEFYACEINHDCRKVLSAKGYLSVHDDINDCTDLEFEDGPFDIVLMNPPFENRDDAKHVRHAYDHLLKPGGFMVAITSRGPWFASDSTSIGFRDWFESLDDASMCELPDGAFNGPDSFRPTGVACNVITIHKRR